MVVLDAYRAPKWLLERYPDAKAVGSGPLGHPCNHRLRGFTALSHAQALALALRFMTTTVADLTTNFGRDSVHAFQPNFNNELEARYVQECDIFTDYSNTTIAAYRRWLSMQHADVSYWGRRWGLQREAAGGLLWSQKEQDWTWSTIMPPNVFGATQMSVGDSFPITGPRMSGLHKNHSARQANGPSKPVTSLAYWDWLKFRDVTVAHAIRISGSR